MSVFYKLTQNKIANSKSNGKWFAHSARIGNMSWKQLCKHIATHGSVYTEDVCVGVGMKLLDCIMEKLGEGYTVKFGDMGTFYLALHSEGTDSVSEFNAAKHIYSCQLRFLPNKSKKDDVNLTSTGLMQRYDFADINTKIAGDAYEKKKEEQAEQDDVQP